MRLKIKSLNWSAGFPVVILNKKTAKKIGVHTKERVELKKNKVKLFAITDISNRIVNPDEVVLSSEALKKLKIKKEKEVEIIWAPSPKSIEFIKGKINKKKLKEKEVESIVKNIVDNSLSQSELALFVAAMCQNGMNFKETIYLIKSILRFGNRIKFKQKYVADKHCIGGVPGNRTTPIIISICATQGLIMPKTSSRAITSPAGTADVIETIAKVDFSVDEIKKIIKKTNACLVWGGGLNMVPADSRIIQTERALDIDPPAQLVASIMAKKLASGSKYILIDIPYGKNSKVNKRRAKKLKKEFEKIGRYFHKKVKCIITHGNHPIGRGIGPALELLDVIKVLDPKQKGPEDLEAKALMLSGILLELTGKAKKDKGIELAKKILYSGEAFKKFEQIIKAQEGNIRKIKEAKFHTTIFAKNSGRIKEINNKKIDSIARFAGCPTDKLAGIYLHKTIYENIKKGEKLMTIYSESKSRLTKALSFYNEHPPVIIK